MSLPFELLQYAENFYRRFPEEFLALGAPGLEEVYDLRPSSTMTRRIQDTPTEKNVEITIRRWQMPPQSMAGYGGMPYEFGQRPFAQPYEQHGHLLAIGALQQRAAGVPMAANPYGHPMCPLGAAPPTSLPPAGIPMGPMGPHMGPPPAAAAMPPRWESELTSRLSCLETALSSLKPQIEVLLGAGAQTQQPQPQPQQAQPQQASQAPQAQPQKFGDHGTAQLQAPGPLNQCAGSSDDVHQRAPNLIAGRTTSPTAAGAENGGGNKLRDRRHVPGLAIETLPKTMQQASSHQQHTATKPVASPQQTAAIPIESAPSSSKARVKQVSGLAQDSSQIDDIKTEKDTDRRPAVTINPVRVAASVQDPQSPRSPGRYCAWK